MGSVVGQHAIYVATLVVAIHWMRMHDDYIQWGPSDPDAVPPMPVDAAEGRKWWYLGTLTILYLVAPNVHVAYSLRTHTRVYVCR